VLYKGEVVLIGEVVYGEGRGIEWFAGHIVATGICMTLIGKVLIVAFVGMESVALLEESVIGAGIGAAVIALPGTIASDGSRSVGFGSPGLEIICIPAKAPWRGACLCL
jgi:hypothetical protein